MNTPHGTQMFSVKFRKPLRGQVVVVYSEKRSIDNGYSLIKWWEGDEYSYDWWFPLDRPLHHKEQK